MAEQQFVFFDLGNVLVNFDHNIAVDALASLTGHQPEFVRHAIFGAGLQVDYELGRLSDERFARKVAEVLHSALEVEEVLEAYCAIFEPNIPMENVLQWVRRQAVPAGILSNTCRGHWEWIRRARWPVTDGPFQLEVLSYQVGAMKPDEAIYRHAEQQCGRSPPQIFFVDDRPENVYAARRRGWHAVLFENAERLQRDLESWLHRR
ncbi:MAG: hydrolase phosphatase [Pirellulaceae bacterium]|nr:MAG: hydrolase phosphatase [Pirellulaceae bacterium]